MFRIVDDYGTNRVAWSWAGALAWLAACGPNAQILGRFSGRLIARRVLG